MSNRPPTEDWVKHPHYVAHGDYARKVGDVWESWDPARGEWFTTPTMTVTAIEEDMAE